MDKQRLPSFVKNINTTNNSDKLFSICTIITNEVEYANMLESFIGNGFTENTVNYYIANNSVNNVFDAYTAIRLFLLEATTSYIIICHQDIIVKDNYKALIEKINALEQHDKNWAIAGNAGAMHIRGVLKNLIDKNENIFTVNNLPKQVFTLDENFLILKRNALLSISNNLNGFHFYGTDLCLQANNLGYTCYVIDFMVQHLSNGTIDQKFYDDKDKFIKVYQNKLRARFIETTCTRMFISGNSFLNFVCNTQAALFMAKVWYKYFANKS